MKTGKLVRWDDEKGYGFIHIVSESRDVFIHISTLPDMSRRPVVGDVIIFDVKTDDSGKSKAVDATIEGIPRLEPSSKSLSLAPIIDTQPRLKSQAKPFQPYRLAYRTKYTEKKRSSFSYKLIPFLVIFVVISAYEKLTSNNTTYRYTPSVSVTDEFKPQPNRFECQGKTHCTQMASCEEATFYIKNCPGTEMDGDNDGIPCERQLCN